MNSLLYLLKNAFNYIFYSSTIETLIIPLTSECNLTGTLVVPSVRIGSGGSIFLRSFSICCCFFNFSVTCLFLFEPNNFLVSLNFVFFFILFLVKFFFNFSLFFFILVYFFFF